MRTLFLWMVAPILLTLARWGYNTIERRLEILNQCQRRADLATNLVYTVKGQVGQERAVMIDLPDARREGAGQATAVSELLEGRSERERAIEVFCSFRVCDTWQDNGELIYRMRADS
jgi:hypothetical protein